MKARRQIKVFNWLETREHFIQSNLVQYFYMSNEISVIKASKSVVIYLPFSVATNLRT